MLSKKLKELREGLKLPQRKVAAEIDIDTATYSKIENGIYLPKREQVIILARILDTQEEELLKLWMADKIAQVTEGEEKIAPDALKIVQENYLK